MEKIPKNILFISETNVRKKNNIKVQTSRENLLKYGNSREGKERGLIAIFWLKKSKQTYLTSKIITMLMWKNLGMFVLIS